MKKLAIISFMIVISSALILSGAQAMAFAHTTNDEMDNLQINSDVMQRTYINEENKNKPQKQPKENDRFSGKAVYLVDFNSGKVLYERDSNLKLPIASMVKIMTLCIVFDNIESGNLKLTDKVTVSQTASGMGGSQMFLDANSDYLVSDLIKGVVICSANDASVALAEKISGDKDTFVNLMNAKAKEYGMNNTLFCNITGLPASDQYSTALDVSIMTQKLLKHKDYYDFCGIYMQDFTHPSGRVTGLVNTNKLIKFYKGCDSGKTGFTNDAMFCLSASAKKGDMRVVATVIGAQTSKERFSSVSTMFDYAFANFQNEKVINKNDGISTNNIVKNSKYKDVKLYPIDDVFILVKKGEKNNFNSKIIIDDNLKAPIQKNTEVGRIEIYNNKNEIVASINLVVNENVDKLQYFDILQKLLKDFTKVFNR